MLSKKKWLMKICRREQLTENGVSFVSTAPKWVILLEILDELISVARENYQNYLLFYSNLNICEFLDKLIIVI